MKKVNIINPFVWRSGIKVTTARVSNKSISITDVPSHGEIAENVNVVSQVNRFAVDRTVPAKCYMDEDTLELFMSLTPAGRKLLDVILFRVQKNSDRIKVEALNCCEIMDCSMRTFYSAIKNLIELNFIAKYNGSEYWINPHLIFKGNRTATYKDNLDYSYTKKN